jgi:hypothetical protein
MLLDIIMGLGVVGAVAGGGAFLNRNRTKLPAAANVAASVSAQVADSIATEMQKVPALVSSEVVRLNQALADATARAAKAEADFATEHAASIAKVEAIKARFGEIVTNIGTPGSEVLADFPADFQAWIKSMSQAFQDEFAKYVAFRDQQQAEAVASAASSATASQEQIDAAKAEAATAESNANAAVVTAAMPAQ